MQPKSSALDPVQIEANISRHPRTTQSRYYSLQTTPNIQNSDLVQPPIQPRAVDIEERLQFSLRSEKIISFCQCFGLQGPHILMDPNVRPLSQSLKQSRRFSENRSLRRQPITGTVCGRRQWQAAPLSSTLACLPSDANLSPLSCSNCFQEYKKRKEKQTN